MSGYDDFIEPSSSRGGGGGRPPPRGGGGRSGSGGGGYNDYDQGFNPRAPQPAAAHSHYSQQQQPRRSEHAVDIGHQFHPSGGGGGGVGGGGGGGGDVVVDDAQAVRSLRQFNKNVQHITSQVQLVGTTRDSSDLRHRITGLLDDTKALAKTTGEQVKRAAAYDKRNQKLCKDYSVCLETFIAVTKEFQRKNSQYKIVAESDAAAYDGEPYLAGSGGGGGGGGRGPYGATQGRDGSGGRGGGGRTFGTQQAQRQAAAAQEAERQSLLEAHRAQQAEAARQEYVITENEQQFNQHLIEERQRDIQEVESTLTEINDMFRDLAQMVEEQGTLVDTIESNVAESAVRAEEGVQNLREAEESQKSSRCKLYCIGGIICLVVVVVIVLAVLGVKVF